MFLREIIGNQLNNYSNSFKRYLDIWKCNIDVIDFAFKSSLPCVEKKIIEYNTIGTTENYLSISLHSPLKAQLHIANTNLRQLKVTIYFVQI